MPRQKQPECLKYFKAIRSGKIVACKKIKQLADMMIPQITDGYKEWHYDRAKADRAVEFIERFCKIPSGKLGQPFILENYERAIVEVTFGFVDDNGFRRFQEVLTLVGRKNGKTSLTAAIELYMLIADGEGAPQIYNIATKGDQADLGFAAVQRMMRQSGQISKHAKKHTDSVYCSANMGYIKPLASHPETLDGLDVHMAVLDELAAMKNRDLYDVMKQGMSSREQPLMFTITTNGFVRDCIFDTQYDYASRWLAGEVDDDRFLAFLYELDDRDEWTDESKWIKANPGIGTVKKWETLRGFVNKAKQDNSFLPTVMVKDFNLAENSAVAWLNYEEAVNEQTYDFKEMGFTYGIAGFDAADTIDLNSAQVLFMRPGDDHIYTRSMYWLPEDAITQRAKEGKRLERDGVPYTQWISRGLMRTVPGNSVPKRVLLDWLIELRDEEGIYTFAIGYDPWHMDETTVSNLKALVGKDRCFDIRQGPKTLSQPMKQIKADYQKNRIVDNDNPVNEWCRMNVEIKTDINGNIQPFKKNGNPKNRIDGFMAEIDAYTVLLNITDDYTNMINCDV